ncbi:MAG: prepilin-type N-terminal cleavage/methylation domain-containing protein [Bilifractor sp.]|nr:prepilin-type N-terminal cleavage/methylation domain-containing protein [Lachnospiraceae bacterium]MDY2836649.1 prepilin-type N-terminal cleavage/methylation domain-containing protein [Bilifractor sp.]
MKKNKKGFTLAELLIVVAIIAVLVAISIPIFTSQLKKARVAVNQANARAGEAAACAAYLENPSYDIIAYDIRSGRVAKSKSTSANIADDLWIQSYNSIVNVVPNDISSWNVNTELSEHTDYKFGDYYFYRYIYTFDKDGTIKKIQANDNYKKEATAPY